METAQQTTTAENTEPISDLAQKLRNKVVSRAIQNVQRGSRTTLSPGLKRVLLRSGFKTPSRAQSLRWDEA